VNNLDVSSELYEMEQRKEYRLLRAPKDVPQPEEIGVIREAVLNPQ
jgi:hypothetical protein